MKNLKKIVSVIILIVITCLYVNTSFGTEVTEENFYDTLKSLKKVVIRTEDANSSSSVTRTYEENLVKVSNCISYYYPVDESDDIVEAFTTEYSINSNIFKSKTHWNMDDENYDEKEELMHLAFLLILANIPTDYIIVLADLTGVKIENAYGYYAENININDPISEDSKKIIKYTFDKTDDYMEINLEVDLEKFAQIDSSYLKGDYAYEVIIEKKDVANNNDNNQVTDKNETNDVDNSSTNETNNTANTNTNRNENTNTNRNVNNNTSTNRNTNTNTNTNRNTNKNVSNNQNSNIQNVNNKIDNTVSENKLPNAGVAKVGLIIIAISLIGIYSYKKYVDYNKMF